MTPDEYQKLSILTECNQSQALARISEGLDPIRANHALIGLANEVGELCKLHQKWVYFGGPPPTKEEIAEEVGDLLWYACQLLTSMGISLSSVMSGNLAKLRARYPNKFDERRAAVRDRVCEVAALTHGMMGASGDAPTPVADTSSGDGPLEIMRAVDDLGATVLAHGDNRRGDGAGVLGDRAKGGGSDAKGQ
jgi:NTP pyrophosphatase (non-canonical NTP hydrolase)